MKNVLLFFCLIAAAATCHGQTIQLDVTEANFTQEGAELPGPEIAAEQILSGQRDGRWVTSLHFSSPGAAGLQFLIDDLRLPAGAKLVLYEVYPSGEPSSIRAIYQGSGPLETGQFWSDAVPGSAALLEVTYEDGNAASLPFRVAGVRHLLDFGLERLRQRELAPEETTRAELEGSTGTAMFRGMAVPYVVRNGLAIFEGDMVLGRVEDLEPVIGKERRIRESVGITSTYYRWPGGVIPYTIDANLPNQSRVTDAIAHWNSTLGGKITLVPRTNETYYVRFAYTTSGGTCSSYVGKVNMAGQPITTGDYCSTGNLIHEIGHAVGLFHEHTREDRNNFVRVLTANITSGSTHNFTQNITNADDIGAYDYGSIMHYGTHAFSSNGSPTIETIPPGIPIGQRSGLSSGDVNGVMAMYGGSAPAPTPTNSTVQISFASTPTGRQLVVDGVTVTAPISFSWTVGSLHTVSAPSVAIGNTRYLFSRWSDGGGQTHSITAPSSAATFTAYYTVQYKVNAASSNSSLGSVAVSPASSDGYFNQGTSVGVSGTPYSSACLTGWSGVSAPATSPIQISVNQSYDILGYFQTGAVTVSPASLTFAWKGTSGSFGVTSSSGCSWRASTSASWIKISSGAGTSSGIVTFSVANNATKAPRQATIVVGQATVLVTQNGR